MVTIENAYAATAHAPNHVTHEWKTITFLEYPTPICPCECVIFRFLSSIVFISLHSLEKNLTSIDHFEWMNIYFINTDTILLNANIFSCNRKFLLTVLAFKADQCVDNAAFYLNQRSFSFKSGCPDWPIALPGPLKWSLTAVLVWVYFSVGENWYNISQSL